MFLQTCWSLGEAQQEVKERWCERNSCVIEGVYTTGLCISRFCLFYMTEENGDQNTWSNSPSALGTKKIGKERVHRMALFKKCEPHGNGLGAPKFWERSHEETLHQERCACRVAWDLAKILQAQECGKYYGLLSYRSKGNAVTHFEKSAGARIRSRFMSVTAHDEHHVEESSGKENRRGTCGSETATSMFGVKKPIERKANLFFGFECFIRPVCRWRLTVCTHAHFSRCARHMWSHGWLKHFTILFVSRKVISSLVMSLLNVPSAPFPPIFSSSPKSASRSVFSQIVDVPLPQILEEIINVAFLTSGASSAARSPNHSSWKKLCRVVQIILRTAHLEARFTARWWISSSEIGRDRRAGKVDKCNSGPSGDYGCAHSTDHWGKCRGSGKCLPGVDFWEDSWTNRGCSCVLRLRNKMCE